jgi:hypothetical protein
VPNERKELERKPRLTLKTKKWVFASLLRSASLWGLFAESLEDCEFLPADLPFKGALDAAAKLRLTHHRLTKGMLLSALDTTKESGRHNLTDTEYAEAVDFVKWTFSDDYDTDPDDAATETWVTEKLRDYLVECAAHAFVTVFDRSKRMIPADVGESFRQQATKVAGYEALGGRSSGQLFGPDFLAGFAEAPTTRRSTGNAAIDHLTAGGDIKGEVYGFLGPYGSCKTLLCSELISHGALQAYAIKQAGGPHEASVIVSYECSSKGPKGPNGLRGPGELQLRLLSSLGLIAQSSLRQLSESRGDLTTLSTATNLKPYERQLFAELIAQGGEALGEYERLQQAMAIANEHIIAIDLSGPGEDGQERGYGYVQEVMACLKAELRDRPGVTPNLLVLDYIGYMVNNYMEAKGKIEAYEISHVVGRAPEIIKKHIAQEYQIPVWLAHQLSGEGNSKGVGGSTHHTDAEGGKKFAKGLYNALVIQSPDPQNRFEFKVTKRRGSPPTPGRLCEIRGDLMRVYDVSDAFVRRGNRIFSRDEEEVVAAEEMSEVTQVRPRPVRNTRDVD